MERHRERTLMKKATNRTHTPFFNITHTLRGQWSPLGVLLVLLFALNISSNGKSTDGTLFLGYKDADRNGVNDIFVDSNGDGVNDIDKTAVCADMKFEDADDDGVNDIFVDMDGDGINDIYLLSKNMPVIDTNKDGINDITGMKYKKGFYNGSLTGFAIEERGIWLDDFKDDDNDFTDDEIKNEFSINKMDSFVDEDGDGICDNRENKMNMRNYHTIFRKENKKGRNK